MAGSSATISIHNTSQLTVIEQWQVQYARFINYRSTTSRSSLTPVGAIFKKRRGLGTWISTAAASLKLIYEPSSNRSDEAVLLINLHSRFLEEHYISKMHFSWPQVSCVSGYPAKGTKVVFVSYKDGLGQIQKFALRFLTVIETEKFMNVLKEILENGSDRCLQSSEFNSELSSQAEVVPSDGPIYRPNIDWQDTTSADISTELIIPVLDYSTTQEYTSSEKTRDPVAAETMSAFPPSFTQLLKNCHPAVVEAKPTDSEENLKIQFMQYLEETSFEELLSTLENVISELGDDLVL